MGNNNILVSPGDHNDSLSEMNSDSDPGVLDLDIGGGDIKFLTKKISGFETKVMKEEKKNLLASTRNKRRATIY
jgi:hypothetical protein